MEKNNSNAGNINIEALKEKARHIDQMLQDASDSGKVYEEKSKKSSRRRSHQPPNLQTEKHLHWDISRADEIFERSIKISRGEFVAPLTETSAAAETASIINKDGLTEKTVKTVVDSRGRLSTSKNPNWVTQSSLYRAKEDKRTFLDAQERGFDSNDQLAQLSAFENNAAVKRDDLEKKKTATSITQRKISAENRKTISEKKKRAPIHLEPVTINWAKWSASEGYVHQEEDNETGKETERFEGKLESVEEISVSAKDTEQEKKEETHTVTLQKPSSESPVSAVLKAYYDQKIEMNADEQEDHSEAVQREDKSSNFEQSKVTSQIHNESSVSETEEKETSIFARNQEVDHPILLEKEEAEETKFNIDSPSDLSTEGNIEDDHLRVISGLSAGEKQDLFKTLRSMVETSEEDGQSKDVQMDPLIGEEKTAAETIEISSDTGFILDQKSVSLTEDENCYEEKLKNPDSDNILLQEEPIGQIEDETGYSEHKEDVFSVEESIIPEEEILPVNDDEILSQGQQELLSSNFFFEAVPVEAFDETKRREYPKEDYYSEASQISEERDLVDDDQETEQGAVLEPEIFNQGNVTEIKTSAEDEALLAFFEEESIITEDDAGVFENSGDGYFEEEHVQQMDKADDEIMDIHLVSEGKKPVFAGMQGLKKTAKPVAASVILNDKENEYINNQDIPDIEYPTAIDTQNEEFVCIEEELTEDTAASADHYIDYQLHPNNQNVDIEEPVQVMNSIENLNADDLYFDEQFDLLSESNTKSSGYESPAVSDADLFMEDHEPPKDSALINDENTLSSMDASAYEPEQPDSSTYFEEDYFDEPSAGTSSRWLAMDEFFRISNAENVGSSPLDLDPAFNEKKNSEKQNQKDFLTSVGKSEDAFNADEISSEEVIDTVENSEEIPGNVLHDIDISSVSIYEEEYANADALFLENAVTEGETEHGDAEDLVGTAFESKEPVFEEMIETIANEVDEEQTEAGLEDQIADIPKVSLTEKPEECMIIEEVIETAPIYEEETVSKPSGMLFVEETMDDSAFFEEEELPELEEFLNQQALSQSVALKEETIQIIKTDELFDETPVQEEPAFEEETDLESTVNFYTEELIDTDPVYEEPVISKPSEMLFVEETMEDSAFFEEEELPEIEEFLNQSDLSQPVLKEAIIQKTKTDELFDETPIQEDSAFEEESDLESATDYFTGEEIDRHLFFEDGEGIPETSEMLFEKETFSKITAEDLFTEEPMQANPIIEGQTVRKAERDVLSMDLIGADPVFDEEILE